MTNPNTTEAKPYNVDLWGSNPDEPVNFDNDDCWAGESYATKDEAVAAYRQVVMFPEDSQLVKVCGRGGWEYVVIDGPDVHELTQNPDRAAVKRHRREMAIEDCEWKRERAMQAGMAFGIDGYNDEMGWVVVKVTADTITDEQIRELREDEVLRGDRRPGVLQVMYAATQPDGGIVGPAGYHAARITRQEARARCTEILNARGG